MENNIVLLIIINTYINNREDKEGPISVAYPPPASRLTQDWS